MPRQANVSGPPKPLALVDLQARLFALITARKTVPDELQARGLDAPHVTDHLLGDERLDAVCRLDIYNSMYFFRLLEDVLEEDYPTVKAVLGAEGFSAMAADYIEQHPPQKPSARYASERLPAFLSAWAPQHKAPVWLPSLAALEWARVDTFDDVDDPQMVLADLQRLDPTALPGLHLQIIRAHRTIETSHAIADVWRAVENGKAPPRPAKRRTTMLVWREDTMVYHRELSSDEVAVWPALQRGLSFGSLCEHLGERLGDEQAAQLAAQWLTSWLNDALLLAPGDR